VRSSLTSAYSQGGSQQLEIKRDHYEPTLEARLRRDMIINRRARLEHEAAGLAKRAEPKSENWNT
jgi:hypothetical protein